MNDLTFPIFSAEQLYKESFLAKTTKKKFKGLFQTANQNYTPAYYDLFITLLNNDYKGRATKKYLIKALSRFLTTFHFNPSNKMYEFTHYIGSYGINFGNIYFRNENELELLISLKDAQEMAQTYIESQKRH